MLNAIKKTELICQNVVKPRIKKIKTLKKLYQKKNETKSREKNKNMIYQLLILFFKNPTSGQSYKATCIWTVVQKTMIGLFFGFIQFI